MDDSRASTPARQAPAPPAPPGDASPDDLTLLQAARARVGSYGALAEQANVPKSTLHHMTHSGRGLKIARQWYRLLRLLGIDPASVLEDGSKRGKAPGTPKPE